MSTALTTSSTASTAVGTPNRRLQQKPQAAVSQGKPQTPQQAHPQPSPQPGTWRHPRFDEILRRQNAAVFNTENINRIALNGSLLLLTFFGPAFLYDHTPSSILAMLDPLLQYRAYTFLAIRALFLINILIAFRPLLRSKDDVDDIALTSSQRALLGLKPSDTPLTPGNQYITPPRYARSTTPRSETSGRSSFGGSPAGGRESSPSSFDRSLPYSQSPLVQKALNGSTARRLSFDSGSGSGGIVLPSTPTPNVGSGRASVGLNNKWLYERGRGSPHGRGVFS